MFSKLPWHIRSDIYDYTVSEGHKKYCLINKEWFMSCAGRFMELDSRRLLKKRGPSKWLSLTESVVFSWYSEVKWDYLKTCTKIKSVTFKLAEHMEFDCEELETFMVNSQFTTVIFDFITEERPWDFFSFIPEFADKVQKLEVKGFGSSFDQILNYTFPNLVEFNADTKDGSIPFDKICKNMPKAEHLNLRVDVFEFEENPDKVFFPFLKTLQIEVDDYAKDDAPEYTELFFRGRYPVLTSCKLFAPINFGVLEKIPRSMPKLKKYFSDLPLCKENVLFFPICPLPYLEDLEFFNFNNMSKRKLIQLDLNFLPRLQKLAVSSNFSLVNLSKYNEPVIAHVGNGMVTRFSHPILCDQLSSLNEIKFDNKDIHITLNELFKLCKTVSKLSLKHVIWPIPVPLPTGPFKTTYLELTGQDFLTNELIIWLVNQPQLLYLNWMFIDCKGFNFRQVMFPYLKNLSITCDSPQKKAYVESIFHCNQLKINVMPPKQMLKIFKS